MNERDKEALSALLDGEATELELKRVLKQIQSDPALADQLSHYQLSRHILSAEDDEHVAQFAHLDISSNVMDAINAQTKNAEVVYFPASVQAQGAFASASAKPVTNERMRHKAFISFKPWATAASVALCIVGGGFWITAINTSGQSNGLAQTESSEAQLNEQTTNASTQWVEVAQEDKYIQESQMTQASQARLKAYLSEHKGDVESGSRLMMPFTQPVNFNSSSEQKR